MIMAVGDTGNLVFAEEIMDKYKYLNKAQLKRQGKKIKYTGRLLLSYTPHTLVTPALVGVNIQSDLYQGYVGHTNKSWCDQHDQP